MIRRPRTRVAPTVLYIMHVDWNWIRQRPHELVEALRRDAGMDVRVAYLPNWRRRRLTPNPSSVPHVPIPQLPLNRFLLIRRMNLAIGRAFLWALAVLWQPTVTVVAFPALMPYVPKRLRSGLLVYDCMDSAIEFGRTQDERTALADAERDLIRDAQLVLASSEFLARQLAARYKSVPRIVLVRNGVDASFTRVQRPERANQVRLGYFGTVSHWFDQRTVLAALDARPNLVLNVWGPVEASPDSHPRLRILGPVPRSAIPDLAASVDGLIMPFVVNDLVRGVDPVKLYEYVALGRPVISVFYQELRQFEGLVHFYSSEEELLRLIDSVAAGTPDLEPPRAAAMAFLSSSTWTARAVVAAQALRSAVSDRGLALP